MRSRGTLKAMSSSGWLWPLAAVALLSAVTGCSKPEAVDAASDPVADLMASTAVAQSALTDCDNYAKVADLSLLAASRAQVDALLASGSTVPGLSSDVAELGLSPEETVSLCRLGPSDGEGATTWIVGIDAEGSSFWVVAPPAG